MGKIKFIDLTTQQRQALEHGYRHGSSHAFRQRCQMILLKSQRRSSAEIAELLGCCEVVVNNWLKRFQAHGLDGLKTKAGRGRKPILSQTEDLPQIRQAVAAHRQRLSVAKAELETTLNKSFSQRTLKRFLKSLVADISA